MPGLVLMDDETFHTGGGRELFHDEYLHADNLELGILCDGASSYTVHTHTFPYRIHTMSYDTSLEVSVVHQFKDKFTSDDIILISKKLSLVEEAEKLKYKSIKLPSSAGELARTHVLNVQKKIDEKLTESQNEKIKLVIALDVDDTIIFFQNSRENKKLQLNLNVVSFVQNILTEYSEKPSIEIRVIVVTARDKTKDKMLEADEKYPEYFMCVLNVVNHFVREIQKTHKKFFINTYDVYYNEDKYGLLADQFYNPRDTLVVLLDDNPLWTFSFDPFHASYMDTPHLHYISVYNFTGDVDGNKKLCQLYSFYHYLLHQSYIVDSDRRIIKDWMETLQHKSQCAIPAVPRLNLSALPLENITRSSDDLLYSETDSNPSTLSSPLLFASIFREPRPSEISEKKCCCTML